MTTPVTADELKAAFKMTHAVAECIRDLKEIPSGHLYANVMQNMSYETYEAILATLKRAKLIRVDGTHLIKWIGP